MAVAGRTAVLEQFPNLARHLQGDVWLPRWPRGNRCGGLGCKLGRG
jgi:hypothetical protein